MFTRNDSCALQCRRPPTPFPSLQDDDDDLSSGDDQNLAWLAAVEEVIDEDDDFESFELADAPRFKLSMHRGLAKVAAGRAFSSATT